MKKFDKQVNSPAWLHGLILLVPLAGFELATYRLKGGR